MENNKIKESTKVLIIGHNVLDSRTAFGKTLVSFFKNWRSENLAELYFHSEVPTMDICSKYFRITDTDALKSILKSRKHSVGRSFDSSQIDVKRVSSRVDTGVKSKLYSFGRKRTSSIYIARNSVWKLSKWYSDELKKWLDEFSPDVIFFAAGDYAFAYRIAYTISKARNIPMVTYICDDYYINRLNTNSILSKPVYKNLMKHVKRCADRSSSIITICDKMTEAYKNLFDKPIYTVYTGYSASGEVCADGEGIVYLGNLGFSRHRSLVDIGRALKSISKQTGEDVWLDVYSTENREEIIKDLSAENGIRFHGAVDSQEVRRIISQSKMVVHVESFEPINIKKVQYSVSTKIADLLASGHCILAYGPQDVASIEYLEENEAACVVSNPDALEIKLKDILYNKEKREKIINAAKALSLKNHDADAVTQKIEDIILRSDK